MVPRPMAMQVIGGMKTPSKAVTPKKRGRPKGSKNKPKLDGEPVKKRNKARCSACGEVGHTKINKHCRMRRNEDESKLNVPSHSIGMTSEGKLLLQTQTSSSA
jgi:hypothetical protein